jgi:hypothetical protein
LTPASLIAADGSGSTAAGAPLGRRERRAIDDQADALEAGRGLIEGFGFGGEFGGHGLLANVLISSLVLNRTLPLMVSLAVPGVRSRAETRGAAAGPRLR